MSGRGRRYPPVGVASFFDACKGVQERRPCTRCADDQGLVQVISQALGLRRGYGCVIGQAGESYGVLLLQSRQDQSRFIEAAVLAVSIGVPPPGVFPHRWAIHFEPLDAISRPLADQIAQHGWPVAADDADPVPLHVDPDQIPHTLNRSDLARRDGAAAPPRRAADDDSC